MGIFDTTGRVVRSRSERRYYESSMLLKVEAIFSSRTIRLPAVCPGKHTITLSSWFGSMVFIL